MAAKCSHMTPQELELTIALACVSVLEDCDPRSLTWVTFPSTGHAGVIYCAKCRCNLAHDTLGAHIQLAPDKMAVSVHRRVRHDPNTVSVQDDDTMNSLVGEVIDESLDEAYDRWRVTWNLVGLGQYVALERAADEKDRRVYCQWCRTIVTGDNMALLAHLKTWQHVRAQQESPSFNWLAEIQHSPTPTIDSAGLTPREARAVECKIERNLRKRIHACADIPDYQLFGCSLSFLRHHIQNHWLEGMTWETYGSWHLDHKLPVSAFDTRNAAHCLVLCHYSNIMPMWGHLNLAKGSRLERCMAPSSAIG